MVVHKDASQLINAFKNGEIDRFSIYVEGLGGFFVSRSKDGFLFGCVDEKMREGKDDHSTVLWDEHGELKGFHRKISDDETDVYMKYDINYVLLPNGTKKLLQDISRNGETPFFAKVVQMLFYRTFKLVFERTWDENVRVLQGSEARKRGLKTPCFHVKPRNVDKMFFQLVRQSLIAQNRLLGRIHAKPTDRFRERHLVGSIVTKRRKKKKH